MRSLLFLVVVAAGLFLYANRFGLAVGYAPFTPVFYWNYTGEAQYDLNTSGLDAIKIVLNGQLSQGELEVEVRKGGQPVTSSVQYRGRFDNTLRYQVDQGQYKIVFKLNQARGRVRYDWVGTKNSSY
ncbi:hypothetical protein [Meiothermus granaticius]|uniref:Uncharacterized protein n=1 Tax=Meiothermus granaticius NBRC 107808 TaxID=1227551 RepID=A0A399F6E8_9DEIN|nr:hypothetical protein [Meiothermus granaticius]RIH91315.1 hypothetical protein Mgrana_02808 [Meiothermus granaticius NBRC 107808]GEM86118.1 hypothetical protein MGR01S_07430 [Meiothermus granaticius NBRC 107808]